MNKSFSIFSCGALSVGDQILSIDETIIENTNYTPEEVMSFLNGPSDRGFTQIQILPVHTINRKGTAFILLLAQNQTNQLCSMLISRELKGANVEFLSSIFYRHFIIN